MVVYLVCWSVWFDCLLGMVVYFVWFGCTCIQGGKLLVWFGYLFLFGMALPEVLAVLGYCRGRGIAQALA